jgi:hypothetical protein
MLPPFHFDADAEPDPAFHFDPDPDYRFEADPDPVSQNDADPDPQHCLYPKLVIADPDMQIRFSKQTYSVSTFFSPKSTHRACYD